jgi:putative SOS response-associated peptidase YedK
MVVFLQRIDPKRVSEDAPMPGRFALISSPEVVRAHFAYREEPDFPPRYNIAPTQPIAIVVAAPYTHGVKRHFSLARWGFLPGFVKDPENFSLLIHARAETLSDKASFRNAVKRRRCLVIADGYYQWLKPARRGAAERAFIIRRVQGEPMGFAGLYETWCDPYGGEIDTACFVTTPANRILAAICDRMPAILEQADFSCWLDNDGVDAANATALLRPVPEDKLELTEIGAAVNRADRDDAGIQLPFAPIPKEQGKKANSS